MAIILPYLAIEGQNRQFYILAHILLPNRWRLIYSTDNMKKTPKVVLGIIGSMALASGMAPKVGVNASIGYGENPTNNIQRYQDNNLVVSQNTLQISVKPTISPTAKPNTNLSPKPTASLQPKPTAKPSVIISPKITVTPEPKPTAKISPKVTVTPEPKPSAKVSPKTGSPDNGTAVGFVSQIVGGINQTYENIFTRISQIFHF
jgi:hypothetical protein